MALTREQSIELGAVISQRRDALLSEIQEDMARARSERFGELAGPAPDPGDQSVADLITDLEQAELGRDLDELRSVEAAHRRYEEGKYGICVQCGSDIDYDRLRAQPAAIRCIDCQRAHEKEHSPRGGGPTL